MNILSPATSQFIRFGLVGIGGLIVDTATLYAAMGVLGLGLYSARIVSYLTAATFTWAANRHFTFERVDPAPAALQWLRFLLANGVGAVVNYGVYAALVTFAPLVSAYPFIGIAAGSIAGLAFNFNASKRWVFKA